MIFQKWLQIIIGGIVVVASTGCAASTTPFPTQTQTVMEGLTPTSTEGMVISPTSIQTTISNFEECVVLGNAIQNTFPRQCIDSNVEIFIEAMPEGILFSKVYGEEGHTETAYSFIITMDGGYLIVGQANNYQCMMRKLDTSGKQEWQFKSGQELSEEFQFANAQFNCWSAAQSLDGEYRVLAHGANGKIGKFFLMTLDNHGKLGNVKEIIYREGELLHWNKDGDLVWLNSFGLGARVIESSDGSYAFIGRFPNDSSDGSIHIFKTDADGVYLWEKNLCQDITIQQAWETNIVCSDGYLRDAIQSQDGGYVLVGGLSNGVWLLKTDYYGSIEWTKSYMPESRSAIGRALVQTSDGGFLIAGEQQGDGMLIKTDSVGNIEWSKLFGGSENDKFITIKRLSKDQMIVLGSTKSFGGGSENTWLLGLDLSAFR
jgi:hypothetical protein